MTKSQQRMLVTRQQCLWLAAMLVIIILQLLLASGSVAASQSMLHFMYGRCNRNTFASNSSFATNLNEAMDTLRQHTSQYYYYYTNSTSADPADNSTFVHALYQCRGDISLTNCSSCINYILSYTVEDWCGRRAPGMRIQLLGCYIRFENYDILDYENKLVVSNCSATKNTNSVYESNLALAFNRTATAATALHNSSTNGSSVVYFNASSVGTTPSTTAYALAQCLFFLTPSQCASCLSQYSSVSSICDDSSSGFFFYVTCYFIFNQSNILLSTTKSLNIPVPSPSISPSMSPASASSAITRTSTSTAGSKKKTIYTGVGIAIGAVVLLAAAILFVFILRLKRHPSSKSTWTTDPLYNTHIPDKLSNLGTRRFSIHELEESTHSFHARNKLGEGGFGPVFKGTLKDGGEVAIKILSAESHQGTAEFLNEVNVITGVQHRNLIQLLGCCVDGSKRLLVFEYLPNRSLDLHLFGTNANINTKALDWKTRFKVIIGIARGLRYLHEESPVRIVHRDIKTSNILLDSDLNPKIADFGLARLVQEEITHVTTGVAGTMGYMAPEYAIGGHLSEKADVYSYGMVALEIISGRKAKEEKMNEDQMPLLEWAWSLYERQEHVKVADLKMMQIGPMDEAEVVRVVHVALLCTQTNPNSRPTMSQVCTMLNSQSTILDQPIKPTIVLGMISQQHNSNQQVTQVQN